MLLCGGVGMALGDGIRQPAFGLLGLVACCVTVVSGVRVGAALTALGIVEIAAMSWLELRGWPVPDVPERRLLPTALMQCLVVCGGFATGALTGRVTSQHLRAADKREQHSNALLRLAAEWNWELDRDLRFTNVTDPRRMLGHAVVDQYLGRTPWEIGNAGISDNRLDAHRADLEARRPFSGLISRRRDAKGRSRMHSISGEPRFAADGSFDGYRGVARDVTDEMRSHRAFAASETRYRELFDRSPSPIFLQRQGVVFDANAAAARLFGLDTSEAMHGVHVADLYPEGESRQRAIDRAVDMERHAIGEGAPVRDFVAQTVDGRPITVQATSVRVDAAGGPATLTIMFDITARLAAEAALRRSETMLSQLFASSPDCITLSETATGRITLVNAAFTRLTGYTSDDVVGRSAAEVGIWYDAADPDRIRDAMLADGRVSDMEVLIATRSGRIAMVLLSAAHFRMDGRGFLVINARDVTDAEETRLEHSAIFERASIGIALTRDRRFVHANPRFESVFGWAAGTLTGESGGAIWIDADDYAEAGRIAGPLLAAGRPFQVEREMRRQDGSRFWCRLLGQAVDPMRPRHGGTIWIADDITERRRIDAALAAAKDAAESANKAKSAFLANTSHEIRTPLNGLLGLARLALRDGVDAQGRRRYLEQILNCAQGLEGILSDILDFSKIEAGKFTLETTAFDLRDLLGALHASYLPIAEAKQLRFDLAIDERLAVVVNGDPVRVRQILGNFVTNAVKFTSEGGIRIEARPGAGRGVRLAVVDSGNGIEAALQGELFQPFSQGDSSTTRRFGGTGLGLSICRQLAHLMGGEVGVDSEVGHGSTFWAELPLTPAVLPGDSLSTEASERACLHDARILLVEDNPVNMMIATATLAQWGVDVVEVGDGRAAIEAVHEAAKRGRPFDLVLMDVQMPEMSGHEATVELRKAWSAQALPIIALTAAALVSERNLALASGMNDFLTKPIDAPKLRRTLARHVRKDSGKAVAQTT